MEENNHKPYVGCGLIIQIFKELEEICAPHVHAVLFTLVKVWEQPKCPSINKLIEKICNICTME